MYETFYSFFKRKLGEGIYSQVNSNQVTPPIPIVEPLEDNNSLFLLDNNGNDLLDNG